MDSIQLPMIEDLPKHRKRDIVGPVPLRPQRPLTETERKVILSSITKAGFSGDDHALALGMAPKNHDNYTANIVKKLGARSRIHALAIIVTVAYSRVDLSRPNDDGE
jgi:DNA-binding CsgD family transcriptional regulator